MPTPAIERLLILEDVPEDAELEERSLLNAGHSFEVRRVASRADFLEALASFRPDLIIADYKLPDIDGRSAIRLVRERDEELPIVLVTGFLDDEAAVEVVKAGATDYVRKDRLARLPIAAAGAVAAAKAQRERREAVQAMQQSARDFEDLYNKAPCGYHSVDGELTIVSMNDTELAWLGYRRDEVVGKMRIVDLLTPDSAIKLAQQAFPRLLASGAIPPPSRIPAAALSRAERLSMTSAGLRPPRTASASPPMICGVSCTASISPCSFWTRSSIFASSRQPPGHFSA